MEFIFYFEIIGTIIFALQGSLVAIEKKLDIFGIGVLALTTAVGGGMIRDLVLANTPPVMFINPVFCIVAILTAIVIVSSYKYIGGLLESGKYIFVTKGIQLLDAVGLGIFTVVGTDVAIASGYGENIFLCSFVGVLTGVGGGLLRDVLANRTPIILKKEIYAVASMIGAVFYYGCNKIIPGQRAIYLGTFVITSIRLIAIHKNWHLPALNKIENSEADS